MFPCRKPTVLRPTSLCEQQKTWGVLIFAHALVWDRRRLACTEREARKTSVAGETPAVPGKSIRKTEHDYRLAVIDELKDLKPFSGYDLIRVNAAEAYAANCLWVNGRVLLAKGYPDFQRQLQELGYETVTLEISEFQKMDGGLSCLSLRF